MQKKITTLPRIKLIGITARTNNASEMNPTTGKIGPTIQHYFQHALAEKIPHRKKLGITYCAYTNYESDANGDYTYFIGEEVSSFENLPDGFHALDIPAQHYIKFTNEPGKMPDVCIQMWQQIWTMNAADLGGQRAYTTDFEIYDERAYDPTQTILDIYIGIID